MHTQLNPDKFAFLSNKSVNKNFHTRITQLIFEMSMACLILLIIRVWKTESYSYLFLVWNLFLAWIPFLSIKYMLSDKITGEKPIKRMAVFIMWFAFLPNAPYILTDLFHLHATRSIPLWFDLILILSFALTGILLFLFSFLEFERKFLSKSSPLQIRMTRMIILSACGYGIYLGRYLRFNSWDVVSAPGELTRGIFESVFSVYHYKETFAVTLFFSIFLYFVYKVFILLIDHSFTATHENKQQP